MTKMRGIQQHPNVNGLCMVDDLVDALENGDSMHGVRLLLARAFANEFVILDTAVLNRSNSAVTHLLAESTNYSKRVEDRWHWLT